MNNKNLLPRYTLEEWSRELRMRSRALCWRVRHKLKQNEKLRNLKAKLLKYLSKSNLVF
jgi:hypothetical protein